MDIQISRCKEKPETFHLRFTTDDVADSHSMGLFALWRDGDLFPRVCLDRFQQTPLSVYMGMIQV